MARKATLFGASGLIGSAILDLLLKDDYYDEVNTVSRKTLPVDHPKLRQHIINFEKKEEYITPVAGAETVFCAVGTTMKKVQGDHDAYRKVDHDIAVYAAGAAAMYGCFSFVLVSSIGADAANKNNFYLKLKGITEEHVSHEQLPAIHIFRPSLLVGERHEKRKAEGLAQTLAPVIGLFSRGKWAVYHPVKSTTVAHAMVAAGKLQQKGIFIHTYKDILRLAATAGQYPVSP